jgi:hypothetical protein
VAATTAAPAAAAQPGLLAQWNFDEGAGQVAHDSGPLGLDATLGRSAGPDAADPQWIGGASGSALRFDGGSVVRLPDAAALAPQHLTVEATARSNGSPGAYRYLVSRGGTGCWSASWGLYSGPTGGLAFYVFDGSRYVLSPAARRKDVWDGAWHRFSGVFDGSALRLFVDGREVGKPMRAPLRIAYSIPHAEALIGQYAGECPLGFKGDIDSARIYSDAAPRPSGQPGLPAAAPGTTLPAGPPAAQGPADEGAAGVPPATPAPPAAKQCTVRIARRTVRAGRRVVIRARVVNAPSSRKVRVTARHGRAGKRIASARVSRSGKARLVLIRPRAGRLTLAVSGRSDCASAQLRVRR